MNLKKIVIAGFSFAVVAFALFGVLPFGGDSLSGDPAPEKKGKPAGESQPEIPSADVSSMQQGAMPGITVAQQDLQDDTGAAGEEPHSALSESSTGVPRENRSAVVDKELLRKHFPDKIDMIPITPEEVAARKKVILARYDKFRKILANRATEAEINAYYDEKEQLTLDRMEIVGFSINEFGDRMDEDNMFRHKTTLMILEKQLDGIPERREKALKRLRNNIGNNG